MEESIATVERVLLGSDFGLDPEDKASVVGAVRAFTGEERSRATTARVKRIPGATTRGRRGSRKAPGGRANRRPPAYGQAPPLGGVRADVR